MSQKISEVVVNVGEIKFSQKPTMYNCAGIGSCVVLFVYEPSSYVGGVAHIMLPSQAPANPAAHSGMYADTSINMLIKKLLAMGAKQERLRAKIVGGANLFSWATSTEMSKLGQNNIDKVKQHLIKNRIYIAAEEVGGTAYKTARCCSVTGKVTIKLEKDLEKII